MDNNNNNSKINRLIYDVLSLRKSILLPEIGVVRVICIGSLKNKPIEADDFPHYNLILTDDYDCDVDLCAEISKFDDFTDKEKKKIIDDWLSSIRDKNEIQIPNCFSLTKSKKLYISSLLNLQLNPFAEKKYSRNKGGRRYIIFVLFGVILACVIYLMSLNNSIESPIEQNKDIVVVPNRDTIIATSIVDSVVDSARLNIETIEVLDRVKLDTIKNDNYIVVGSFRTEKQALQDKKRLSLMYKDIEIFTIKKVDGKFINYIFKSDDVEFAEEKKEYFAKKYPRIRGIWVYEMKNN